MTAAARRAAADEAARADVLRRARRRERLVAAAGPLEADTEVLVRAALPVVGTVRAATPPPTAPFVSRANRRRRRRNRIRAAWVIAAVTVLAIALVAWFVVTAAAWT